MRPRSLPTPARNPYRSLEATSLTIFNCWGIYCWFYLQFESAYFHGIPYFLEPKRPYGLEYHIPVWFGKFSIPDIFLGVSLLAALLLIPLGVKFTRGAKGRGFLIALLVIFCWINTTFAALVRSGETILYEFKKQELAYYLKEQKLRRSENREPDEYYTSIIQRLEPSIAAYEKERLGLSPDLQSP